MGVADFLIIQCFFVYVRPVPGCRDNLYSKVLYIVDFSPPNSSERVRYCFPVIYLLELLFIKDVFCLNKFNW